MENVSRDLFVSKGNLSEMENGIRIMRADLFDSLVNKYGIPFHNDPSLLAVCRSILVDLFDSFVRFDDAALEAHEKRFLDLRPTLIDSCAYYHVRLTDFFLMRILHKEHDRSLFEELEQAMPVFLNDEKALIYFAAGLQFRKRYEFDCRNDLFHKASGLLDEKLFFGFQALVHYYEIQASRKEADPFDAYVLCVETSKFFYQTHNYLRCLYLDNTEALCLISCHQLQSALKQLDVVLANIGFVQDEYLRFCVLQNRFLVLALMGRHHEALSCMEKEADIFRFGLSYFMLSAYCLYMEDEYEKALQAIAAMQPYARFDEEKLLFRTVEAAINGSPQLERLGRQLLDICIQIPDYQLGELVYLLLIHCYTRMNDSKRLLAVQSEYISYLTE